MASAAGATAKQFARAIVMPNLKPPVVTAAQAKAYHGRIMKALPKGAEFQPLMTLYLNDNTAPAEIEKGKPRSSKAATPPVAANGTLR